MIDFWSYAGLMFAAALGFILVPQLRATRLRVDADRTSQNVNVYRERLRELKTQYDAGMFDTLQLDAGRAEAARELLDDAQRSENLKTKESLGRAIPLVAALATPLLALVLYLHWGALDQLELARQHSGGSKQNIQETTARIEALLATKSDSAEGWSLLGRAYLAQNRAQDAAHAFERAATLAGRPPVLLGRWAEALYFAGDQRWTPELQALTDEALAGNPQEASSLKVIGMAAFHAGRYAEAATYWERLAAALPDGDPRQAVIADDIARARELAKAPREKGARP